LCVTCPCIFCANFKLQTCVDSWNLTIHQLQETFNCMANVQFWWTQIFIVQAKKKEVHYEGFACTR